MHAAETPVPIRAIRYGASGPLCAMVSSAVCTPSEDGAYATVKLLHAPIARLAGMSATRNCEASGPFVVQPVTVRTSSSALPMRNVLVSTLPVPRLPQSVPLARSAGSPLTTNARFVPRTHTASSCASRAFVTSGAGFQFESPPWLATIVTTPVAVNVRFVPSLITPGPLSTAKLTGRPEAAVAINGTVLLSY